MTSNILTSALRQASAGCFTVCVISGTVRAMQALVESPGMHLEAASLLRRMRDVRDSFWRKQCTLLQLSLAGT